MSDNLEDFLKDKKKAKSLKAYGSMSCQECEESVSDGFIDEDEMILFYYCSNDHENRIKL